MPKTLNKTKTEPVKKTALARPKKTSGGSIAVFDIQGTEVGFVDVPKHIQAAKGSEALIAQALRVYSSRQHIGTKHAKTRGEVSGSTRKIFRQKGTGKARHGSIKAPIFVGGGVAHGPKAKNWRMDMPKTMRRKALYAALWQQAKSGNIRVIKGAQSMSGKTKEIVGLLSQFHPQLPSTLIVVGAGEEMVVRAARNIPRVDVMAAYTVHVYAVLAHRKILMTETAMKYFDHTV